MTAVPLPPRPDPEALTAFARLLRATDQLAAAAEQLRAARAELDAALAHPPQRPRSQEGGQR